ncbi:L-2-amino-thiazoline-4-carboxylic acid hydrolase [Promethearchaeum syntrophicum]|uniref:L-2-amino-thiazoline-4-carboxylic acid hydrolase n=1 Tax=Promethearchaeum syntrophicum TaxID=2594042 RepID=A0A5B9DAP2_9ARCH|nr:L-2-amino-thiazoline-4-carboxylic acid hydrolase [Candidatus Prometheoarchaeum syntrophicum]QEE16194.1 hypothetical protein DSAG12_02024 [Candidatus Prometheoarchaeum syntrophicum]
MKVLSESYQRDVNKTQKIELFKYFQAQFDELDMFLSEIQKEQPTWMDEIFKEYTSILREKTNPKQSIEIFSMDLFSPTNWKVIGNYLDKLLVLQHAMLSFLDIINTPKNNKKVLDKEDIVEVPFGNYVRFAYYHVYYFFHAIMNLHGKEIAYDLARKVATKFYSKPNPKGKKFDGLVPFMSWMADLCKTTHDFTIGEIDNGSVIMHTKECLWGEALKEVEDPNLMYFLICMGDFYSATKYNENFVLTRNKTILQNHGICDFCYHDKRKESEIVHPDESFWNSL